MSLEDFGLQTLRKEYLGIVLKSKNTKHTMKNRNGVLLSIVPLYTVILLNLSAAPLNLC